MPKLPCHKLLFALLTFATVGLTGCSHLHPLDQGYVYVVTRKTYLRDRLAVVANHVADIQNGEKLAIVERDTRFYKVRTPDGKVGWLEEHLVIDQPTFDQFASLARTHEKDPVVAHATLENEIYLHLTPGRKTTHFYLLPANDKLDLLVRASVPKPLPPQAFLAPKPLPRARRPVSAEVRVRQRQLSGSTIWAEAPAHPEPGTAPDLDPAQPWMAQPMEDWWLVRDTSGRVGWILAHSFDISIPDEVAQYSEGRLIVGAYLLNTVMDDGEAPAKPEHAMQAEQRAEARTARKHHHAVDVQDDAEPASAAPPAAPHPMGQYVTVTAEYKNGLPYDWDQVRVFIWNTRKHRYETAYRLRDQQGFLPLVIGKEMVDKMGEEPTFTIRTSPDGDVTQAADGTFHPKRVDVTQYRLEGGIVRRDTPLPGASAPGVPGAVPARKAAPAQTRRGHLVPRRKHRR